MSQNDLMDEYNKIGKQIGVTFFFTILVFLLSPILTVLLTRVLTIKEFGIYSLLSATIAVLSWMLIFGLNVFIPTKLTSTEYTTRVKSIFSLLLFEVIFLVIIFLIIFIPFIRNNLLQFLKLESYGKEFNITLAIISLSVIFILISSYIRANRKLEMHALLGFLYQSVWIIFLGLFFLLSKNFKLIEVLYFWLFGAITSLILSLIYIRKDIYFFIMRVKKIDLNLIKKALVFGLPLIPVAMCSWLMTIADRYILNYFIDVTVVGIYSLSYALVSLILSFSGIIYGVLFPYISKAWDEKNNPQVLFNALLKYTLVITLPGMVGLFVLKEQIITLVSGPKYLMGSSTIVFLLFFPLLSAVSSIYSQISLLNGKTKLIAFVYIVSTILNIGLNILLIPFYGINGAAIATVISYFFLFLVFYFISRGKFSWNFSFLRITRIISASFLMGFILMLINPQTAITKIATIIVGIIIYPIFLFLFNVFVKEEYVVFKSFLPKFFKKLFKIKF